MHLKVLGSGDAFGTGGRLNSCFLIDRGERSFLIDCGASALVAMRRYGVDPTQVRAVLITHLHGDHFGGLPFLILDGQLVSRRTRPLLIVGPPGLGTRLAALMEAMFPGSSQAERRFPVEVVELEPGRPAPLEAIDATVTGLEVVHPSGAPSLALRVACDGKVVCTTGDTEWTHALLSAAQGADLLIAEAYTFERKLRFHLDYATLRSKLPGMDVRRVLLTHMSADMLGRLGEVAGCEIAEDGLEIEIA